MVAMAQGTAMDGGDDTENIRDWSGWNREQQWLVRMVQQTAEDDGDGTEDSICGVVRMAQQTAGDGKDGTADNRGRIGEYGTLNSRLWLGWPRGYQRMVSMAQRTAEEGEHGT